MKLALVALVAACQQPLQPSYARDPRITRAIERLAQPLGDHGETADLAAALAAPPIAHDKLVAWAAAHGSLDKLDDDEHLKDEFSLVIKLVNANDDAIIGAAAYFAARLRDEGTSLLAMMFAVGIETKLASLRHAPNPAWRTTRVRDDEAERLLAAELVWEIAQPYERDWRHLDAVGAGIIAAHDHALANGLQAAPAAWYGIEITAAMTMRGDTLPFAFGDYLRRWTAAAGAYNKWLDR